MWCDWRAERGADDAECTISEGDEFSATVRMRRDGNAERGGRARRRRARAGGSAHRIGLHLRPYARRARPHGRIGHRTGADHHRRSARRTAGGGRTRLRAGRPGSVFGRRRGAGYRRQNRAWRASARRRRFAVDPRIVNSEGASLRFVCRPARLRQLARFLRRLSHQQLLAEHRARWRAMATPWSATTGTRAARSCGELETPEQIGRIAAERALRRLGARKVATQKACPSCSSRAPPRSLLGSHLRGRAAASRSTARRRSWPANWARRSPPTG